jgi:cysteine desulfurase family protein (TIGR01976 family)
MTTASSVAAIPEPQHTFSTDLIRERFPALQRSHNGLPVAYFDGPGGTQVPREVVNAMADYLFHHNANTHWQYPTSHETDVIITRAREAMAQFFNSSPDEIVFGNNMTTLTFHVARALGRHWRAGDEIIVTELDHAANVAPWVALAKERGVTIRWAPFDIQSGQLLWPELEQLLTSKTRLLAIGAASNALGTITDIRRASNAAHARGALCFVDAVHFAAHRAIDIKAFDCDFLVCSSYKFYGPHAGILYGRADLLKTIDVPKLEPAPDTIPDRVETGTQNHEAIAGIAGAVDFLASLGSGPDRRNRLTTALSALHLRGDELLSQLWQGLSRIPGVKCYGPAPGQPRTPTLSFTVEGMSSREVAQALAAKALFLSNGNFYANTVVKKLNHAHDGLVRAGCACYTTEAEVQRLIDAIANL